MAHGGKAVFTPRANPGHAAPSRATVQHRRACKAIFRLAEKCCVPSDRRGAACWPGRKRGSRLVQRSWLTEPISTQQPVDPHPMLHNEGDGSFRCPSHACKSCTDPLKAAKQRACIKWQSQTLHLVLRPRCAARRPPHVRHLRHAVAVDRPRCVPAQLVPRRQPC